MRNIKKIIFSLFIFTVLICNLDAEEAKENGITVSPSEKDGWVIENSTSEKCNLDKHEEPNDGIKITQTFEPTFGFTYENTCTQVDSKSSNWCSEAKKFDSANTDCNGADKPTCVTSTGSAQAMLPGKDGSYTFSTSSSICTGNFYCNGFVDYYSTIKVRARWDCTKEYDCSHWNHDDCEIRPRRVCKYISETCSRDDGKNHSTDVITEGVTDKNDCSETICNDYNDNAEDYFKNKEKIKCDDGFEVANLKYKVINCSDEVRRYKGKSDAQFCSNSDATKVEAYTYKLKVNNDLEAYCINPSFGFNKNYAWDTTFDASKCVDSLHSYVFNETTKKYELQYDMECGYVYILSEAKRINEETNKEVFNYSTISTAMRLFGTGVTVKDKNIPSITDLNSHLQSAGYYAKYYGWNGQYEYVAIPRVIPLKDSSWPVIYRYFMPEFYSIYLNTAKVVDEYLKDNYRLSDVGNTECKDNELCATGNDGKKYIVDADYYLSYKECSKEYKCTSSPIDINGESNVNDFNVSYESKEKKDDYNLDSFTSLSDFYFKNSGQVSKCSDTNGLGVLCGEKDEEIKGGSYNKDGEPVSGGKLGSSNYLDAIYLYIRALQGNKVNLGGNNAPIEGSTRAYNEVIDGKAVYTIKYSISDINRDIEVSCDTTDSDTTNDAACKVKAIFIYDINNNLIDSREQYDKCKKNFCYVYVERAKICKEKGSKETIKSLVITDPNEESNAIKKIANGSKEEQVLYVYDPSNKITSNYCYDIDAVRETLTIDCPCEPKENSNLLEPNGNIKEKNVCTDNYNDYDELYYGDPSMSTILYACNNEDKLKYDYTDDLNINGNDIIHDGEVSKNEYAYQMKQDDFGVCNLYCRLESRAYLANKTVVRAGMALKYDIGQALVDQKILNKKFSDKFSPIVILEYKECTSKFDYDKWKKLYNNASVREKNQLIYSAYNCNLYSTEDIRKSLGSKADSILGPSNYYAVGNATGNSWNNNYAEPAMIDYTYSGKTAVVKNNYGTTKDYLLSEKQKACESIGLKYENGDCGVYNIIQYENDYFIKMGISTDNTYLEKLGVDIKANLSMADSNLNKTIYCSGDSCYKLKGDDGKYYYNPNPSSINDYTVVTAYDGKTESGNILSYSDWGKNYSSYGSNLISENDVNIPKNDYSSFVVVTGLEFYNDKTYFSERYSGIINNEETLNSSKDNVALDKNVFPLHLSIPSGTYSFESRISNFKTAYARNSYYTKNGFDIYDNLKYNTDKSPSTFDYVCYYDVLNENYPGNPEQGDDGSIGYVYRIVDLEDVFPSVDADSSVDKRDYPENWANDFSQSILSSVQSSKDTILEPDDNGNSELSYLEYSFTLTKEGIKRIRRYNNSVETSGGYLNDTLYGCEYDDDEGIFYNCRSEFLSDVIKDNSPYRGLVINNRENLSNGLVMGESEYCSNLINSNTNACKYQFKGNLAGDISDFDESGDVE